MAVPLVSLRGESRSAAPRPVHRPPRGKDTARGSIDFDSAAELLILTTDEFNDLVVRRDLLIDSDCERLRIRLGIVERHIDFELAVGRPADALDEPRLIGIRAASHVEPAIVWTCLGPS